MSQLASQIAVITGAGRGIGRAIALKFAAAGADIVCVSRNGANAEKAAGEVRALGRKAWAHAVDVAAAADVAAVCEIILAETGKVDILVNNAGVNLRGDGLPGAADPAVVQKVFDTNFFGALRVVRAMLPLLRKSPAGRIVNISSGLGSLTFNSDPSWSGYNTKLIGYSASKAALNMLTAHLAYELRDTKIKVNSADPGYTKTDLNDNQGPQPVEVGAIAATRLALLDDDGPTGGSFSKDGPDPW